MKRYVLVTAVVVLSGFSHAASSAEAEKQVDSAVFRAGAAAVDVSPTKLPVIVNGNFFAVNAERVVDPLHARAVVLDDGHTKIAICVIDSCVIPRELADQIKIRVQQATGIATDRVMISATHTHSAPSLMQAHGSDADPHYPQFLMVQVISAIERAQRNLVPAEIGWTVVNDERHTNCRQWIFRPDRVGTDPFGAKTVRANMHPGHENPDCVGPQGPIDPALSLLSVRTHSGRPIALLANYSMHYFGAPAVSADYFCHFARKMERLIDQAGDGPPPVAIMSQGTSGDAMWPDYGRPKADPGIEAYAQAVAEIAHRAYQTIRYQGSVPLAMCERTLKLRMRVPDGERLAWAREVVAKLAGGPPRTLPDIYAREQIYLDEHRERDVKLQAMRIGALGIVAMPCEVFGITGLKIKAQSPLEPTINIELANGEDGYIPPPEAHKLGGYTTWACRTAGLEVDAEPKIVETVLQLLEEVSGRPRRKVMDTHGPYAQAVLAAKPAAYWRLNDWSGRTATDATGNDQRATLEDGFAFYLDGPQSSAFSGEQIINRAIHLAGGRLLADLNDLGNEYSVELWFWNGLPNDAREMTGYLFARGRTGSVDRLAIAGKHPAGPGKLLLMRDDKDPPLAGHATIEPKTWHHLVLVRAGRAVKVYLDGDAEPQIVDDSAVDPVGGAESIFVGGDADGVANLEGKLDEVSVYRRALTSQEVIDHHRAANLPPADPATKAANRP